MKVFVTGVTGFAGSYLIELLLNQGYDVTGLIHPSTSHQPAPDHPNFRAVEGDLLKEAELNRIMQSAGPDIVYHLAGQASPGRSWEIPAQTLAINAGGTANILRSAVKAGSPRVLLVSSADLYGNVNEDAVPVDEKTPPAPENPYSVSKLAASLLGRLFWQRFNLPTVEARPFNHIGPRQALGFVVPDFASQLAAIKLGKRPPEIMVGNLEAKRDFTDVRDVVNAYRTLAEQGRSGEAYLICSGRAVSIGDLLAMLIDLASVDVKISQDVSRYRPVQTPVLVGSSEKIAGEMGWRPSIPLSQSLDDTFAYWMATVQNG